MNLGILGAGRVGASLARAFAEKGHTVTLGHRDPQAGAARWQGPPVHHATLAQAVAAAPLVINATPGDSSLETLTALRNALRGKTLLDVANASERLPNGMPGGLLYPGSSLAERLQAALPETQVVKSLNTMFFSVMTAPQSLATAPKVFLSGNDGAAKAQVRALLAELGWADHAMLDLGAIASAQATEALMLMVPHVIRAAGFRPFALTVAD
ncbi:NADPH-dependent F420 reductase [Paraburkholderia acidisoli]|uniref:NADP oxidoreductase n=1 Tax=Paraburkholderia acidisoli TaxID=2571748 RepID=A0A7Z2GQS7_9BURK|nr:NAD(P)-binding domain-containing protein [Paraburkholderia acidisoli]QGZ66040.1 NADP oxidoreductase [Paraburkholderia acidisoli]